MSFIESYNFSVTPIHVLVEGDTIRTSKLGIATGFFYEAIEHEKTPYLITNRHVAVNEEDDFYPNIFKIIVHTSRENVRDVRIVNIPLYDNELNPLWLEYPFLKNVDVIAISLKEHLPEKNAIEFWTLRRFATQSEILSLASTISVLGYPLGFYDEVHNLPITMSATVASTYGVGFQGELYFLINATLHEGMSGSPVIIPRAGLRGKDFTHYHSLVGVLSERKIPDLGAVWYCDVIREIISNQVRGSIR